jgi:hypothetical protein
LHKLHLLPSQFIALDTQEKAFVIASINIKMEAEKAEADKMKSKRRK